MMCTVRYAIEVLDNIISSEFLLIDGGGGLRLAARMV
jgi:hypothetical protein